MKYNGLYYWIFSPSIKKVICKYYGKEYACEIMKKSKVVYRELLSNMDDIGDDNPMLYNVLFALSFVAPYIASERKITPEVCQEMMRQGLYSVRWYFSLTNVNTKRGKASNMHAIVRYMNWYTVNKEKLYPTSFKIDFVGKPYKDACYYRITRCPIVTYCKRIGVEELMPLFCELDNLMVHYQHGVLHRKNTIASGGEYCDYFIVGNQEQKQDK